MTALRSAHHTRVADGAAVLELAAVSDAGPRAENQDAWAALPLDPRPGCALLLADGMGGHADGAVAAYLAVHGAGNVLRSSAEPHAALADAVGEANEAISRHRALAGGGAVVGTTLVVAVVGGGRATLANVGDSRAYLLRGDTLLQLTVDHSWVAEQVRSGRLLASAVAGHPHRSLLMRALTGDPVEVDLFSTALLPGDLLVICSDGLWDPLGDDRLRAVLSSPGELDAIAAAACDAALSAGGGDNVTAVLCRVVATR